jgi:hypothetical protein
MRRRASVLAATALVFASCLAACGVINVPPAGSREWRITVENLSNAPANLFVAEDLQSMGPLVGTAVPSTVAPGVTQEVVFTVPPGDGWAIFVNPSPERGPLILAADVPPDVAGPLPVSIGIGADGSSSAMMKGESPGWFGN